LINEPIVSSTTDVDDDMEILPFERIGHRRLSFNENEVVVDDDNVEVEAAEEEVNQ
jgi:hypothetical protein